MTTPPPHCYQQTAALTQHAPAGRGLILLYFSPAPGQPCWPWGGVKIGDGRPPISTLKIEPLQAQLLPQVLSIACRPSSRFAWVTGVPLAGRPGPTVPPLWPRAAHCSPRNCAPTNTNVTAGAMNGCRPERAPRWHRHPRGEVAGSPPSEPSTGGTFSVPRTAERPLADAVPYLICPMARAIGFQFLYLCVELIL